MLKQLKDHIAQSGLSYEDYLSISGSDEKKLEEQRRADALRNIKASLVVNKIMNAEGLGVTNDMLEAQYKSIADQYHMDVNEVRSTFEKNKNQFVQQLANKIFTDFMLANNEVAKEAK